MVDLRSRILTYTADLEPGTTYAPPDDTQRERVAESVGHLLDGDATEAERLLAPLGLKLTRLTDTESGRRYDEIAAARPGRAERWGRLYLTADSGVRWHAQVPHPVSDRDTERLGIRLLEDNPGGSLVLAGAHREAGRGDAADVAHRADSVFHTIVVELQKRDVPGVQLHGFARDSDRPYEAVLSTGAARSTLTEAAALADGMEADGLRVCRGWSARCPLEGTANVQGKAAERHHAKFLHVELSPKARGDGTDADAAARALSGLVTTWNSARR
ncbi:hypothetical protein FHS41_002841 [Streptomyces violarus]|uniref:N-formylglutamate amidohydrolase n=1 Tax=Streptomyces violarus TaxID=67380 RepID=A0A7W4ZPN4_9ACTN|nr:MULTISPECIES: hypothetical protein [Streptomyces]MBB3076364.1 hypothetical protein [Streptomyces violarus]WRT99170.1 hypothetical protein VJ737_16380 [Streptomyces sp. CGMCC 4.1772]